MNELVFLAVEEAIPADHPAAWLAVPIGILLFGGSIYLLLWSSYGARKAAAIYGVGFFGFCLLIGMFWWFGAPGIPSGLGVSHLPGQRGDHYQARWFAFEAGSERAEYFPGTADLDAFVPLEEHAGLAGEDEATILADPAFASLSGSVNQAVEGMREQYLPVDENSVALIGAERRSGYEEDAATGQPSGAAGRSQPFFEARDEGEPRLREDPDTGVLLATQRFQTYAIFVDEDTIPLEPVPVGEPVDWFAFHDPGATWLPSALWTVISLLLFVASLLWLDRMEMREKRLRAREVEQAEDLQVPIAQ